MPDDKAFAQQCLQQTQCLLQVNSAKGGAETSYEKSGEARGDIRLQELSSKGPRFRLSCAKRFSRLFVAITARRHVDVALIQGKYGQSGNHLPALITTISRGWSRLDQQGISGPEWATEKFRNLPNCQLSTRPAFRSPSSSAAILVGSLAGCPALMRAIVTAGTSRLSSRR